MTDFSKLFHLSTQPMWLFDPYTLRFLDVNDAAIWNYGYTRDDFMTMTICDIKPQEDLHVFRAMVDELDGDRFYNDPVRHKLRDGTIKHVQITCYAVMHQEQPAYLVVPLHQPVEEPFTKRLQMMINKLEFTLLQRISNDRKRFAELHSLASELESGLPVSRQLIIINRIKDLLGEVPNSNHN